MVETLLDQRGESLEVGTMLRFVIFSFRIQLFSGS